MGISGLFRPFVIAGLIIGCACTGTSQPTVSFRTGEFPLIPRTSQARSSAEAQYLFYKADQVLSFTERKALYDQGIQILYALQDHLYWVRVTQSLEEEYNSRLFDLPPSYKLGIDPADRSLANRFRLTVAKGLTKEEMETWTRQTRGRILDTRGLPFGLMDVEIPPASLDALIETSWIAFIQAIPVDEPINYRALPGERGWGLISPLFRGLDGSGMTVGIGDGGRLEVHEDLARDYLDLASFGTSSHATQVSGIITGACLVDPFYGFGYAPNAHILLRNFSDILWSSPDYLEDYGMCLTNNSYGAGLNDCTYMGDYDGTSSALDAMVSDHPQLLHVISAGNSGNSTCAPYPTRYATIAGGYQCAKNVLVAGAITNTDGNATFSSRGPVDDGRLKPEIVAYGSGRFSTIGTNQYSSNSGTSFSSPATTGVATLLYERFKQLHGDTLPEAALIKNVLCNSADDLGNAGPDYTYGFGRINGERAVRILEDNQYTSVLVDQGNVVTKNIVVTAGTAAIDIMLLWSDVASAPYETVTLVNDLDLRVVNPAGDTLKPWLLNVTPSGVALAATTGADRFNNYEQVTIAAPVAGTYVVVIKGYQVPLGPQKAWLTWDAQSAGLTVQSPNGGEVLKPGNVNVPNDRQYIRWDAFGTGSSTFTVEYSTNGGTSWTTLATAIAAAQRYYDWFPPNIPTAQLKVRVSATNGMQDQSDQNAVIMAPPENLAATTPCNGNVYVSWSAVSGASYYQLVSIKNERLSLIDTTSSTSITLHGLPVDSVTWISVAGVFSSGATGLRARAISVTPNGGNQCNWNHDLRLDSLVNLHSGRIATSTALSTAEVITIHLTNLGLINATGFTLSYTLDNSMVQTDPFPGTLNSGTGQNFSFSKPVNLSAPGIHHLRIWTNYALDPFHENDTLDIYVKQLANPAVALPWNQGFETLEDTLVLSSADGLPGMESCDIDLQAGARVRTFAGHAFNHSGQRSLTLDAVRTGSNKNGDILLTVNLSSYHVATDDIRLSFYAMHHEIIPDVTNTEAVWIRGADTLPFIQLLVIPNDASARGIWQYFTGLEVSEYLANAGQDVSSSFQIKFSHGVYATSGQINSEDGQTIDDIALHRITKDLKLSGILHPVPVSCDLGMENIQVTVTNTTSLPVANASVYYQVNNGTPYSTFVGTVAANATIQVALTPAYNFSPPGLYKLVTWVNSAEDAFHQNDTLRTTILHTPFINTLPYLEGFENGDGGWIADGTNSSWEYGVPGKQNFSHAAEGRYVWTTSLNATHHADEMSYLYSPCFDLSGMIQPYLSFAFQYQLESGYDYAWVEYKLSGGSGWVKLGSQGSGTNWYNQSGNTWNGNQLKWITTGIPIPFTDTTIQFRWVMQSDVGVEYEGLAIDQVHVYDRKPIYAGANMQWTFPVSGNAWVHLESGGQRIFSIHPEGQNLGTVTLNLYKSAGNYFTADSLYLLSRNWVLTCSNPPVDTILMRGYFTATEATNLVNASGCNQCINARDGFELAALRYTGSNQDGAYNNNTASQVHTYTLDSTRVVPYDNGYYAQWSSPGMSEWWVTTTVTKWSGILEKQVSSTADDAEEHEYSGAVNPYRNLLALTERDGRQTVGWRFKQVTIPKGCYIHSAHLEWTAAEVAVGAANWTMRSELSTAPAAFTPSKYNISLRSKSAQAVQWSPGPWNMINTSYTSPELKHLVQQVVDQAGWVTGRDMVITLQGDGWREAWSYDGDVLKGAKLVIDYDSLCTDSGIRYVDLAATGVQDGSSWTNAYRSLEQALDLASHCTDVDEIWIADGTYTLYPGVARTGSYTIRPGVRIYGGFQGNETSTSQRIAGAYPTLLSGDIGTPGSISDNTYHVVTIQAGTEEVLLDGLTIRDGNANGSSADQQKGSGIYNLGKLRVQQVTVKNCSVLPVYNAPGSQYQAVGFVEIKL